MGTMNEEGYKPPWEQEWERAKTLRLPEPAALDPEREVEQGVA
jgi:hypothetical protein